MRTFLSAYWEKLLMANYVVKPEVLMPYLPAHTELDIFEGKCYVSLVAFLFRDTKLLGLPIPFHRTFEEVNLRFYVRHYSEGEWRRGVVFVRELVPKYAISWVANLLYQEPYQTCNMRHVYREEAGELQVQYEWKIRKAPAFYRFSAVAEATPQEIPIGSEAEFITEHYWGYTPLAGGKTAEYSVTHPRWRVYPVKNYAIGCNFGILYGQDFEFLNHQSPDSVLLAEGSPISVLWRKVIS
ncbi:MAG: DUF2071 domain-containing protein [Bacteroidetes bacterium]|nr:MAG: DUF2071 domain-containing protein [Bacteroidota bacterium]